MIAPAKAAKQGFIGAKVKEARLAPVDLRAPRTRTPEASNGRDARADAARRPSLPRQPNAATIVDLSSNHAAGALKWAYC
jgi:hypothetical protein